MNHASTRLYKDGWTITHDPLTIPYGKTEVLIDLGAEQLLAAERNGKRIAVEIKSFIKPSPIQDLKEAIGQFVLYTDALADFPNERIAFYISQSVRRPTMRCFATK